MVHPRVRGFLAFARRLAAAWATAGESPSAGARNDGAASGAAPGDAFGAATGAATGDAFGAATGDARGAATGDAFGTGDARGAATGDAFGTGDASGAATGDAFGTGDATGETLDEPPKSERPAGVPNELRPGGGASVGLPGAPKRPKPGRPAGAGLAGSALSSTASLSKPWTSSAIVEGRTLGSLASAPRSTSWTSGGGVLAAC